MSEIQPVTESSPGVTGIKMHLEGVSIYQVVERKCEQATVHVSCFIKNLQGFKWLESIYKESLCSTE